MVELSEDRTWREIGGLPQAEIVRITNEVYQHSVSQLLVLSPHTENIPDVQRLTIVMADRPGWVLHLFMGQLRKLIAEQSNVHT